MKQQTLAMASGFERYGKKTRRTLFLEEREQVVQWSECGGLIEPVYAKAGNGRPPVGAERMLRIYFLQQWFNLSDPGVEEALYDSAGMRQFVGIDLGREPVPDENTVCKFRHLLGEHGVGEGARSGDAPDAQGQAVVLRDEGPRGSGQPDQADSFRGGDGGECSRFHDAAPPAHGEETRVWGDQAYRGQGEVL